MQVKEQEQNGINLPSSDDSTVELYPSAQP